jgi:hypothetical protein
MPYFMDDSKFCFNLVSHKRRGKQSKKLRKHLSFELDIQNGDLVHLNPMFSPAGNSDPVFRVGKIQESTTKPLQPYKKTNSTANTQTRLDLDLFFDVGKQSIRYEFRRKDLKKPVEEFSREIFIKSLEKHLFTNLRLKVSQDKNRITAYNDFVLVNMKVNWREIRVELTSLHLLN